MLARCPLHVHVVKKRISASSIDHFGHNFSRVNQSGEQIDLFCFGRNSGMIDYHICYAFSNVVL